jgi:hypothetical protein
MTTKNKNPGSMKNIRSIRELELMEQKLRMKEELDEKNLTESSSKLIQNLTGALRDIAFEAGTAIAINLYNHYREKRKK